MTAPKRTPLILLLLALTVATGLAAAPQRAVVSGAHDAPLTATVPGRPADHRRHAVERHALLHPRQQAAAEPRRDPAGGQRRVGARRRRPARARALRRAHGLQRHAALPEAGRDRVPAVDRHALRRAHQRQHQLRSDGLRAADSDRQPGGHRQVAADPRGLGDTPSRSSRPRSTRSAASSSRSGARVSAPTRGCSTCSCRSCSRIPATPSACPSASRRSSARSPTIA